MTRKEQSGCLRSWGAILQCVKCPFSQRLNIQPVCRENLGPEPEGEVGRSALPIVHTDPLGDFMLSVPVALDFARFEVPVPKAVHLCQVIRKNL